MQAQAQQYPSGFARNLRPDYAEAASDSQVPNYEVDQGVEQHGFVFGPGPEQHGFFDSKAEYGFGREHFNHGQDVFVDAAFVEVTPDWVQHGNFHRGIKPSHMLMVIGCVMLFLTVIMPVWEAYRLMYDPTFVYFVGREYCMWVILLCLSAIFLYCAMISLLFAYAREEGKTEQNVMGSATTVIMLLGLALLLIAQPLKKDSKSAYEDLFFRCASTPRTQRLMEYSTALQTLRNQTGCASQISVEQCEGYHESQPYTGYLKTIERSYKCSGFCSGGADATPAALAPLLGDADAEPADSADAGDVAEASDAAPANGTAPAEGVGLLAERPKVGITLAGALQKLAAEKMQSFAKLQRSSVRTRRQQADASMSLLATDLEPARADEGTSEYPPTLFTDANYQTSCDGMAARVLRYEAMEAADMLYGMGVALVFVAIAVTFLEVANFCTNFSWLTDCLSNGKGLRLAYGRRADP